MQNKKKNIKTKIFQEKEIETHLQFDSNIFLVVQE